MANNVLEVYMFCFSFNFLTYFDLLGRAADIGLFFLDFFKIVLMVGDFVLLSGPKLVLKTFQHCPDCISQSLRIKR